MVLSSDEAKKRFGYPDDILYTRIELVEQMEKGSKTGRDWALVLYSGTYATLSPEDQRRARENPEYLIQRTIEMFRDTAEKRKSK